MATKTKKPLYRPIPEELDQEAKKRVLEDLKERERAVSATPEETSQEETQKTENTAEKEKTPEPEPRPKKKYPWEHEDVSNKVTKAYNIRLKEPEFEKLKYVVKNSTDKSINGYVLRVLMKQVEKDLKQMI